MDDTQNSPPAPKRSPERLAREAEALRANLRRRKDQARQREREKSPDSEKHETPPET